MKDSGSRWLPSKRERYIPIFQPHQTFDIALLLALSKKKVCSGRIFFFTKAKIDRCCGDHKKQNKDQKQGSVEGETGFAHIHFNSFALHIIPKQTIKREPADRSAVFVV